MFPKFQSLQLNVRPEHLMTAILGDVEKFVCQLENARGEVEAMKTNALDL